MQNFINWFEIPAADFSRATRFYRNLLGAELHEMDMAGTKMGLLPSDGSNVSGAIVQGQDYKPSADGITVYLNAGTNLQIMLDRVEPGGGKIIVPKTQISPEMGYFAFFIDTEGNKMGLHSMT